MQKLDEIFSRDGSLKAVIHKRADGLYQVEFHQRQQTESQDFGPNLDWEKLPGVSVVESLESAVELASSHVGAGTEEYFDEDN